MKSKTRILLVQAESRPLGGKESVFAWVLHALCGVYDVTVLTWNARIDVDGFNRRYGTSVAAIDFRLRRPSWILRAVCRCILAVDRDPGSIQAHLLLMRSAQRISGSYELAMNCEMESDLGVRGVQYIHYPWLSLHLSALASADGFSRWQKWGALLNGKLRPWMWIGNFSFDRMRANRTLTNSNWTGRHVQDAYGIETTTLYPPAAGVFPCLPWNDRQNGFLCIGRIHHEKRIDWLIEALKPLRCDIPDLHLHIVGIAGNKGTQEQYLKTIQDIVRTNSSWVTLHLDISRAELARLAVRQRYGVHAMLDEHFGMAVAEMVRAGCIPFVHDSGGTVEIVLQEPRLLYKTGEDLRTKILHVARSPVEQHALGAALMAGADRFSPERFVESVLTIIASGLAAADESKLLNRDV